MEEYEHDKLRPINDEQAFEISKIIKKLRREEKKSVIEIAEELNSQKKWHIEDVMSAFDRNSFPAAIDLSGERPVLHVSDEYGRDPEEALKDLSKVPSIKWNVRNINPQTS